MLDLLATQVTNAATTDNAMVICDDHGRCWLRGLWFAHTSVLNHASMRIAAPRELGTAHSAVAPVKGLRQRVAQRLPRPTPKSHDR